MAQCKQCSKVFEAKRADARYCSDACQKAARRSVRDKSVSEINVRDNEYPPRWMTPLQWRGWMRERRPDELARLRAEAGTYREYTELPDGQYNRVAKPGDADYVGVCVKVGDNWQVGASQVQT